MKEVEPLPRRTVSSFYDTEEHRDLTRNFWIGSAAAAGLDKDGRALVESPPRPQDLPGTEPEPMQAARTDLAFSFGRLLPTLDLVFP